MLPVIFVGGSIVPHRTFDPVASLRAIEKHRVTDVLAIPLMTEAMLDAQQRLAADGHPVDLSSLSAILSSGTMSPPGHFDRIDAELGWTEVTTGYGMSETTASSTVTRPDDPIERRRSTNGRLRDAGVAGDPELGNRLVVYRTVDPETDRVLDHGEVGELQARGPGVTAGYWEKPAETAAAFTPDGWFRTGDLGRLDKDGYLTLVGRAKDCYRCGGEQVVPKDVEDVLLTHAAVEQALVVPVPDARMGEAGAAFIVRRPNTPVTEDELIGLAAQKLAKFKVPRYILWIDAEEIPLTASGRPRKFLLAERAAQSVSAPGI
jgi:fatty-acyl-CoA synthase